MQQTGLSFDQVKRALAHLKKRGLIETKQALYGNLNILHIRLTKQTSSILQLDQFQHGDCDSSSRLIAAAPRSDRAGRPHCGKPARWNCLRRDAATSVITEERKINADDAGKLIGFGHRYAKQPDALVGRKSRSIRPSRAKISHPSRSCLTFCHDRTRFRSRPLTPAC